MRVITLDNAIEVLKNEEPVQLSPIYKDGLNVAKFVLVKHLTIKLSNGDIITIPKGFRTDLSSVPNFLWPLLSPYGDFLLAAIIHDYLYVKDYISQEFADKEMLIWSNVINPRKKWDNYLRYWGVRLFGRSVYIK